MKLIKANLPQISGPLVIGALASRNGSDWQAVIGAINSGKLNATAGIVISNNYGAKVLEFARKHNIPSSHISRTTEGSAEAADKKIRDQLLTAGVNLIILSGYMRPIGPETLAAFPGKILNVHPAIDMERFAGLGMYGDLVHKAVLESGEKETGVTIHIVNERYDQGPIVAQEKVPIAREERIDSLREKVQAIEKRVFITVLQAISSQ